MRPNSPSPGRILEDRHGTRCGVIMAVKDTTGKDLIQLTLQPDWKHGHVGMIMSLEPAVSVIMPIDCVDELIGELIKMRDAMEKLNPPKPEVK